MIHKNKKAYFDFFIEEEVEAGICLLGSEVKSIREGRINLKDSYIAQKGEEFLFLIVILVNIKAQIASIMNHEGLEKFSFIKDKSTS